MAATNIDALLPPVFHFQSYENASLQLPVVQVQPLAAAANAQAFATGAVAIALPAQPRALLQSTSALRAHEAPSVLQEAESVP